MNYHLMVSIFQKENASMDLKEKSGSNTKTTSAGKPILYRFKVTKIKKKKWGLDNFEALEGKLSCSSSLWLRAVILNFSVKSILAYFE